MRSLFFFVVAVSIKLFGNKMCKKRRLDLNLTFFLHSSMTGLMTLHDTSVSLGFNFVT